MLALVKDEEQTMLALVAHITATPPMTFDAICQSLDVPRTKFLVWLQEDESRWNLFLKAHEARSINLVSETIGIADGEGDAADKKLRVETRFRYAKHHAPSLYGAEEGGGGGVVPVLNITVMAQVAAPRERVVNGDDDGAKGKAD